MARSLVLVIFLSILAPFSAAAQSFYYAPYLQLSATANVSTAMGNLDAAQTLRANILPLRVIANGYGNPADITTYAVVAPNTTGDDAPASTAPAPTWTVGVCTASFTTDISGHNVWNATTYASMAAALVVRDALDAHVKSVAYVLTPPLDASPAVLLAPNIGIHCP